MGKTDTSSRVSALRTAALALALLGCLALPGVASSATYKWVDANGRVVYSDQPPTGNVKAEIVQGAPPPANPNAVKELASKEADFKKRQIEAADNAKKADTQRAELAKKGEQCTRAQTQIKQLAAEQIGLVRYNEKGEIVYVDDATRRKEREQLELWVKANCPT
jgi:hypothetical protein